ncbi:Ger(x)C family spore germination protein [Ureibacillus sp. Re31]|uniref:Ger(X)C family spore germination protein n=1 Tax=Ureibacillus galli TaxID=2762222 RepID=A0ABR8XH17_9BACL|nr:Ger(x)C family spore germination protein [Ureibacillus galli]MBD8028525.1 Ger(x)C family spore germination protein [Ureibacillus galli]
MNFKKCFLLIILVIFLSGCWDKKELNEIAVVMGVGIDKVEEGYKITAQVIKPPPKENGSTSGSELPTWSVTATGKSVLGTIRNLNELSPRRLYWAHLQIIIFGDAMAREGITPATTWFERDRDSRAGALITVTPGTAEDLLNSKIELGDVPAKSMAELIDGSEMRGINALDVQLRDLMSILSTPGIELTLDVIRPKEIRGQVETFEVDGVAVFDQGKLQGYIYGPETTGTQIMNSKLNYTIIEGKCPKGGADEVFAFQITDFQSKVKPKLKGDTITVNVDVTLEGNLLDQTCGIDLLQPEQSKLVEKEITHFIKKNIEGEFRIAKEMNSDIYGIGRDLRRYHPDYWAKISDSSAYLDQVKFDIKVESEVRRSGLIIDTTQEKTKEVSD